MATKTYSVDPSFFSGKSSKIGVPVFNVGDKTDDIGDKTCSNQPNKTFWQF